MRKPRDFNTRPLHEQKFMIENTWCEICNAADIGLTEPQEYEEDGVVYISGKCRKCNNIVTSAVEIK